MTDKTTGGPLQLSRDGRSGPYLIVRFDQLPEVTPVLNRAGIHYWVDQTAVQMSGGPVLAVINFGKNANPDEIQSALDRA